jgi:hypothetical protein
MPATEQASDGAQHPTIAKRLIFDGNAFDIPHGTSDAILNDNHALRRAYATAMAKPELTQAQIEEGTTLIDDCTVPTVTLRVRPQVKGASTEDAPSVVGLLRRIPAILNTTHDDHALVRFLLRGGALTIDQAVCLDLGDRCDRAADPGPAHSYGGVSLCSQLDTIPSDAGAAPAGTGW